MDLVDDIDTVASYLRRYTYLVHKGLDILDTIVRSCIELVNAVGSALGEREAGLAGSAWFHILRRIGTIDHLREDTGCGGLADASRSAEEICVRKLAPQNRVLEGLGYIVLAYKGPEGIRPVLSG